MTKRLFWGLLSLAVAVWAQPPLGPAIGGGTPVYVLYRMMFRHILALDAAAAKRDAASQTGGAELRGEFQKELRLSDADAAIVKSQAGVCIQQLNAQDAKAVQTISTAKSAIQAAGVTVTPVPSAAVLTQLNQLEQERTSISNSCIQSLRGALSARTFGGIDVYVRSVVGGKAVAAGLPLFKPTAPLSAAATAAAPGATGATKQ